MQILKNDVEDGHESAEFNFVTEPVKTLREELTHLDQNAQYFIGTMLNEKYVVGISLYNLRPAEVPIENQFEWNNSGYSTTFLEE